MKQILLYRLTITSLIWACFLPLLAAERPSKTTRQIDLLPNKEVTDLTQDADGFLWIATRNGLFRYDGSNIQSYRNDLRRIKYLSNNNVRALAAQDQYLYIATATGIDLLDRHTDQIAPLAIEGLPNHDIARILASRRGHLWIASSDGLFHYNPQQNTLVRYDSAATQGVIPKRLNAICLLEDHLGQIWVGSWDQGLYRLDYEHEQYYAYPKMNARNNAHVLHEDAQRNIWVGTWDCGLQRLNQAWDPEHVSWTTYTTAQGLSSNIIYSLNSDNRQILIGTQRGLDLWEDNTIHRYTDIPYSEVTGILFDRQHLLCAGMLGQGVALIDNRRNAFDCNHIIEAQNRFNTASIGNLTIDHNNQLWISVGTAGLARISANGQYTHWRELPDFKGEPELSTVNGLMTRRNGEIWFCTYGEYVYSLDPTTHTAHRYDVKTLRCLPSRVVYRIFEDYHGNLWFGGIDGLGRLTPNGEADIISLLPDSQYPITIVDITEDRSGNIWLATTMHGIIRMRPEANDQWDITQFQEANGTLLSNETTCLLSDSQGRLWCGTKSCGLHRHNTQTDAFDPINYQWSLPCASVNAMLEEPANPQGTPGHIFLWLGTENGLINLDIAADGQTASVYHYTEEDGLQDNGFNERCAAIGPDERMYFGGRNGYNSFLPAEVTHNTSQLKVQLITPHHTDHITVPYDEPVVRLEFSALNLGNPRQQIYTYQLQGYDSVWHYCDENARFAEYRNLPHGDYVFVCQLSNNPNSRTMVRLTIETAPWQTPWAIAIYIIIVFSLIWLTLQMQLSRRQAQTTWRQRYLERQRQIEQLQQQNTEQAAQLQQQSARQMVQQQTQAPILVDADQKFLEEATECVNRHIGDPTYSQQEFLSEMNISKTTCFRRLKSLTGLSFPNFVRSIRMNAACRALDENPNIRIGELAYSLGYNDARYFSACFRNEIGMLPSEYAQKNGSNSPKTEDTAE